MTAPASHCPCCGGPITRRAVAVDLNSNTIAVGWHPGPISLRPMETELAWLLVQAMPIAVRYSTLIERLWGAGECDSADIILRAHVSRLRKKIAPLELSISTIRSAYRANGDGGAYRLTMSGGGI